MIVLKIGGTSMDDASRMDQALDIAEAQLDAAPLMVCSAMGGTTDHIVKAYTLAAEGRVSDSVAMFQKIEDRHRQCAEGFLEGDILQGVLTELDDVFAQFTALLRGLNLLRECSARSQDTLLSFGERLSTFLIHARAKQRGMNVTLHDARTLIRTDEAFTAAKPDMDTTFALTTQQVKPQAGHLLITQGFIASSLSGVTTTLGRGGSDYSASILGAALNAEEIQIWTDVDGIMTSDPRIIPTAETVPKISYKEAGELAFFGAKVIHPATIQPAVKKGIPVFVKNSKAADKDGTLISSGTDVPGLKAISSKKNITLLSISSSRMLEAHGFLKNVFAIFDAAETPVDLVSTSEVSISMTIEKTDGLQRILSKLENLGEVSIAYKQAIICMVGQDLWKDPAFSARALGALKDIPIQMISLGASEVNLSLVVPEERADESLKRLHSQLFPR